jgi:hypothetical protein
MRGGILLKIERFFFFKTKPFPVFRWYWNAIIVANFALMLTENNHSGWRTVLFVSGIVIFSVTMIERFIDERRSQQ